jgi:hypothetical protein
MKDLHELLQKQMKEPNTPVDLSKLLQNKSLLVKEAEKMLSNISIPEEMKVILRQTIKQ